MGNEKERIGHSGTAYEKKCKGAASIKQPNNVATATICRDERIAYMQPLPTLVTNFLSWDNYTTFIPAALFGNGDNIDLGGSLRSCSQAFWYSRFQNLHWQSLANFQYFQTGAQQNTGLQHNLVVIQFIPVIGMPSQSNMFLIATPINIGAPMTIDGLTQSAVSNTIERVLQGEVSDVHHPPVVDQPIELQRQANRRFPMGFQLDLLLLLKLMVVVFVFNQDGSKDRLFILLFLAAIVYMYQTGALAPLLHWFSQLAQRAMMPPQQPEYVNIAQGQPLGGAAMGGGVGEGEQNGGHNRGQQGLNMQHLDAGNWWGLFKEIQMLIVGFVTSLLPGYQHAE